MNKFVVIIVVVAVAFGVYFLLGTGNNEAEGEYDNFAMCVYESGLRMYGSATCSICHQQRELFGPSFEHVREIECDPRNAGAQTELCIEKNITHTPTWILEDEAGNNITKFDPGLISLERLAEISGCSFEKDPVEGETESQ